MVIQKPRASRPKQKSLWFVDWLPPVDLVGEEQMPTLRGEKVNGLPQKLTVFTPDADPVQAIKYMAHNYRFDDSLNRIYKDPGRFLSDFSKYGAVICPDFSLYREMPRHERVRSSWASKAVGAFLQHHGLKVIPNVRWAELKDLDFVLEGIPRQSAISISTQMIYRDKESMHILKMGLRELLRTLEPEGIFLYGKASLDLVESIGQSSLLIQNDTDISKVSTFGRS